MGCEVISAARRNPLKESIKSANVPSPHSRKMSQTTSKTHVLFLPAWLILTLKGKGK